MALLTDDCDLREVYMQTAQGGNGDYYITLYEYPQPDKPLGADTFKMIHYRMAMSGGATSLHSGVRMALASLHEAMEEAGLNTHPKNDVG